MLLIVFSFICPPACPRSLVRVLATHGSCRLPANAHAHSRGNQLPMNRRAKMPLLLSSVSCRRVQFSVRQRHVPQPSLSVRRRALTIRCCNSFISRNVASSSAVHAEASLATEVFSHSAIIACLLHNNSKRLKAITSFTYSKNLSKATKMLRHLKLKQQLIDRNNNMQAQPEPLALIQPAKQQQPLVTTINVGWPVGQERQPPPPPSTQLHAQQQYQRPQYQQQQQFNHFRPQQQQQAQQIKPDKGESLIKDQTQTAANQAKKEKVRRGSSKRSSKPLMEKKRRARINECLDTLKNYVLKDSNNLNHLGVDTTASENQDEETIARTILKSSGLINRHKGRKNPNKLEKADILELAVDYVRRLNDQRDFLLGFITNYGEHLPVYHTIITPDCRNLSPTCKLGM